MTIMENNSGLLDLLRDRGILDVQEVNGEFAISSGGKTVNLSLTGLHALSEELRSLTLAKAPAIAEDYFALANYSFQSLPLSEKATWLKRIAPGGFTFTWDFLGETVFNISGGVPFDRFSVTCYGEPGGRSRFFDSFTDAIQSLKVRCRNALGLYSALREILNEEPLFCTGIAIASLDGGYAALCKYEDDSDEFRRTIKVAVGPINVYCDRGSHFVEEGKAHVLLTLRHLSEFPDEEMEFVAPYEFDSEQEAIAWIKEHATDLRNPEEFDAACMKTIDS